jgi:hypothetical protein
MRLAVVRPVVERNAADRDPVVSQRDPDKAGAEPGGSAARKRPADHAGRLIQGVNVDRPFELARVLVAASRDEAGEAVGRVRIGVFDVARKGFDRLVDGQEVVAVLGDTAAVFVDPAPEGFEVVPDAPCVPDDDQAAARVAPRDLRQHDRMVAADREIVPKPHTGLVPNGRDGWTGRR